jgi:uncharacterized protein YidB (DUF937 family)
MGLLDTIFGGGRSRGSGGTSPLTLGLLALLAYRTYQGKGRLADMLGRSQQPGNAGRPPGGTADGLGNILGDLFGGAGSRPGEGRTAGGGLGDLLRGGLGGVLGGAAAGTLLNGGLGDLLGRMRHSGLADTADSWVGHGPNRAIDPQELESAIGRDTLQSLSDETGRPYMDVLSELSQSLPGTIDQLTPEGREPTDDEAARWI